MGKRKWRIGMALAATLAAGCVGIGAEEQAVALPGLGCVDDSRQCLEQRQAALSQMLSDPARKWVREPSSAQAYASGVRMIAFKQKRKDLTCEELGLGRKEADAAPGVLRAAKDQGLTPAQISRGVMLAGEVGRELAGEQKKRCKA